MNKLTEMIFKELDLKPYEYFRLKDTLSGFVLEGVFLFDNNLRIAKNHQECVWRISKEYSFLDILSRRLKIVKTNKPLLTEKEKKFLRCFKNVNIVIKRETKLNLYENPVINPTFIDFDVIDLEFAGLEIDKKYTREELGL